jgi:hypothetical protein
MNYKPFYSIIRELANGKITKKRFIIEWELNQKRQKLREQVKPKPWPGVDRGYGPITKEI